MTSRRLQLAIALALCAAPLGGQAVGAEAAPAGRYTVAQSVELGYRATGVTGSIPNFQTFVNLNSGPRLLNESLEMRASPAAGGMFDNLSLSGFGFGGDPNQLARLRVDKGKWYEFSGFYRRDLNVFNYNLLDNPLNPASATAVPVANALHSLDLSHRMMDFDLRVLPLSRLSFRVGYSRNVQTGPSFSSLEGGTDTQLFQNYRTTLNSFRAGADLRLMPRTTLSYDQSWEFFKQDTTYTDQNQNFQLSNGVPVDLGVVFNGSTPCAGIVGTTAPAGCNAFLSYSRIAPARSALPTEGLGLHSDYWKNLDVTGHYGYNSGRDTVANFSELLDGNTARTLQRGSQDFGSAFANRIAVNADSALVWTLGQRARVFDTFTLDRFENPGNFSFINNNQFAQAPLTAAKAGSLLLPPAVFSPANCPAPYTAATCPQHVAGSAADFASGLELRFLGQNRRENTVQFAYDFTPAFGGRIGYRRLNRRIVDEDQSFYTAETFDPGAGAALAFRGDCALLNGALPAACVKNSDGSVTFSGPLDGNDAAPVLEANIHGNSLLLGMWARGGEKLRVDTDLEFFDADQTFTRMTPRQSQRYNLHAAYVPRAGLTFDAVAKIEEDQDNAVTVGALAHNRAYGLVAADVINPQWSFEAGFNNLDMYSEAITCFSVGASPVPAGLGVCPVAGSPVPNGGPSAYRSDTNDLYFSAVWHPAAQVTAKVGYAGDFMRGTTLVLNPLQPSGPLRFDYNKPFASLDAQFSRHWSYAVAYGFQAYHELDATAITGLAPIPGENFRANLLTTSMRYSF